ncbi:MAG: NAD(P)-dependent oxidoreductase, partial [Casimicrobium sp.]
MKTIAFLGLGAMGSRMAKRLLDVGYRVRVWNRTPDKAAALAAEGAIVAATPREAAHEADIVISMVFDDAASRAVWLDEANGAIHSLNANTIAIESSTLSTAWIKTLANAIEKTGASFIDAPVAGSRPQADAGQLIFMVGGETQAVDAARDVFSAMGGALHHVG